MATPQEIQLQQALNDLIKDQRDLIKEINNELKGGINYTKEVRKQYNAIESISDKLVDDAEELVELDVKQLEKERVKAAKALEGLQTAGKRLATERQQIEATRKLTDQEQILLAANEQNYVNEKETLRLINLRIDQQKSLNKAVGLTGALLKGSAGLMEKLGFSGTVVEESLKKAKVAAYDKAKALQESGKNIDTLGVKIQTMTSGLKSLGKSLFKSLSDPLVLLTAQIGLVKKFYDLYGDVNQRITDQGKQLNINKEQSQALYENAFKYASEQRNAFVTEARILEGRAKLNEALGTSIVFSEKEAITAEKLSHYYGINEEQNAHLAILAREIGQTNNDLLNTVIKTTVNQKAQFGGALSQQKILQKVSSVSGEILTKFKGNVSELTKAVMQADRLGLTLDQVDKIGESLLNFEQSIESELKAELLTGKAINLEKARSAALSGDTVKLTNEIATQVGNIHNFEKLNTIQRQAYAEAFGMTASEMGDMLRKREFETKLGADAQKSAEEQLKIAKERGITIEESVRKDLEAKSLAELQKYTFEKIKSVLERIAAGPMATIFKYLEKGLKFVESIFGAFSKMTGGGLGNALGAAILGAPLLLATTRLMAGGLRGLLFQRGTDANPMVTRMQGAMGAGLGSIGGNKFVPGLGLVNKQSTFALAGTYQGTPAERLAQARQAQGAMGMRNMGIGAGLGIGGMALSGIAGAMAPGAGADAVGVLGQTASFAGMGMMFGPLGAGIGALVGLTAGLFQLQSKADERNKAEEAAKKEADKKTNDLLESLAVRPVNIQVGPEKMNNALNQYGKSALEN